MAEAWTIGRLLGWTADYLAEHGSDSPRLEAEVLLAHARGCKRIELYTSFEDPADDALRTRFRGLVKRRAEGAPVAYLVGHREFYSLDFLVTPDVLIPRPETEFVVLTLLDLVKALPTDREIAIADVGAGSGIIGITAAKHIPRARVTAVDISPAALAVARDNAARIVVSERMEFIESDLLAAVSTDRQFDIIASNPPYVTTAELAELAHDVRLYEPELALAGGATGTEIIERLIPQAATRLGAGGSLLLEISPMLQHRVEGLVDADGRFERSTTVKDMAGLARVVVARKKSARQSTYQRVSIKLWPISLPLDITGAHGRTAHHGWNGAARRSAQVVPRMRRCRSCRLPSWLARPCCWNACRSSPMSTRCRSCSAIWELKSNGMPPERSGWKPSTRRRPKPTTLWCVACGPASACWDRCWRGGAGRSCRCRAVATSARGRSICIWPDCRPWGRRSGLATDM